MTEDGELMCTEITTQRKKEKGSIKNSTNSEAKEANREQQDKGLN